MPCNFNELRAVDEKACGTRVRSRDDVCGRKNIAIRFISNKGSGADASVLFNRDPDGVARNPLESRQPQLLIYGCAIHAPSLVTLLGRILLRPRAHDASVVRHTDGPLFGVEEHDRERPQKRS